MSESVPCHRRRRPMRLLLAGLAALAGVASAPAVAAEVSAVYTISLAGISIGRADANSHFDAGGYSIAVRGFTSGISRVVSDAQALLASNGRISGGELVPAHFELETTENGLSAAVRMTMRGRSVANFRAEPNLSERDDRVPLTAAHRRNVVDPLSGFIVTVDRAGPLSGEAACNRTVAIFDGWQRYDVRLSYRDSRTLSASDGSYSGQGFVCSARYVPVAGHIVSHEAVRYMAGNTNLAVTLIPVEGTRLLIPYEIVIGTRIGDLVIRATSLSGVKTAPNG